jgi:hypothetical protein
MLKLKPACERCGRSLAPDSTEAMICTFECTWCSDCVAGPMDGQCPNCGGNLERRPIRTPEMLKKYPPLS